jgi:hypothetical protein
MKNDKLEQYLQKYLCHIPLKQLSKTLEANYKKGDEVSLKNLIKKEIDCIPKENFRYLLLFIADHETKMKLYFYAISAGRIDLLNDIRGLNSKDFKKILESFRSETKRAMVAKDLNKALKRENELKAEEKRSKGLKQFYKKISPTLYI